MEFQGEVEGFDELKKTFRRLGNVVAVRTMRSALRFGFKSTVEAAKAAVPYDGNADSDGYSLRANMRMQLQPARVQRLVGTGALYRLGPARVTATASDSPRYAISGGLGTSKKAPNYAQIIHEQKPFIDIAVRQTTQQAVKRVGESLVRAVKRLVRK